MTKWLVAVLVGFGFAAAALAEPYMQVNGTAGDYATFHYYIDESSGQQDVITIDFWPNEGNLQAVELFSNLNRRDLATLYGPDASQIVAGDTSTYWGAYTMQNAGNGKYSITLPIQKCGAYRVTCRYKVNGDPNWRWAGKRDSAVVISDSAVRDLILYELQVNAVDATGDDWNGRSTFADLMDSTRFNLDYVKNLGVNTLWLMPFHPIGSRSDGNYGTLGSPYSIKNMWKVGEHLGRAGTRDGGMQEFKAFMAQAEQKGVNIMFDTIFNHTAKDAEVERNPDNPAQLAADPLAQIRYGKYQWYSKYTGDGSCYWNSDPGGSPPYQYWAPADSSSQVGPAPADRHDFGKWCDTIDLFWGSYSALGNPSSEADGAWTASTEVRKMTDYYAYFFAYWLHETSNAIDGFRCDFAQGLPPQAWEYLVNKAKSIKPELAFMAESLDGGAVSKRAGRQFDIINDSWVWGMLQGSGNTAAIRNEIDSRKTSYGFAGVMRGLINHDQSAPANKWWTLSRYAIGTAVDGQPQMFMGQELGYTDHYGFSKFRNEYDRWIPNIRELYNMQTLWNDNSAEKGAVWNRYADINKGRQRAAVLRLANQWYLDQTSGAPHDQIFSVMKYEKFGWDAADQELVLCFVNLNPTVANAGTFKINVPAVYLSPTKLYNVRNLASSTPNNYLWAQPRTGADLAANGLYVGFGGNVYAEGSVAQFLKLEQQGGDGYQYSSMSVAGTFNGWNLSSAPMTKAGSGVWQATVTLNNATAVRLKFAANNAWTVNFGEANQSDLDVPVSGTAEAGNGDILINGTLTGDYKFTFNESSKAYTIERVGGPVDTDGDGLPDDWETQFFGNLDQGANGDPDGDGKSNMTEYLAGWNPTVPNYLSNYSNLTVAGTFNGWNAALNNMHIVADYTWQADLSVTNASAVRFKFAANSGWTVNFGETNQTDKDLPIAGQNAELGNASGDILVNGTLAGNYRFTFNEQTKAYTVQSLITDTDNDGLADSWETQYFGNLSQGANDDPDGDGKSNLLEYQNGWNPTVKNFYSSYAGLTVAGTFNGWNAALNNMSITSDYTWSAQLVVTNAAAVRFKFAANGAWTVNFGETNQVDKDLPITGQNAEQGNASGDILINGTLSGTYTFVFNEQTKAYTVTAQLVDTDGDGLPDGWEVQYFGNLAQAAAGDPDADGKSNLVEYQNGTDPTVANFVKNYTSMTVAGTFNGWNAALNNMSVVADNTWSCTLALNNATAVRFKFAANGAWTTNFGEQNQAVFTVPMNATAELGNYSDIVVNGTLTGNYKFTFNDATRAYSLVSIP